MRFSSQKDDTSSQLTLYGTLLGIGLIIFGIGIYYDSLIWILGTFSFYNIFLIIITVRNYYKGIPNITKEDDFNLG